MSEPMTEVSSTGGVTTGGGGTTGTGGGEKGNATLILVLGIVGILCCIRVIRLSSQHVSLSATDFTHLSDSDCSRRKSEMETR